MLSLYYLFQFIFHIKGLHLFYSYSFRWIFFSLLNIFSLLFFILILITALHFVFQSPCKLLIPALWMKRWKGNLMFISYGYVNFLKSLSFNLFTNTLFPHLHYKINSINLPTIFVFISAKCWWSFSHWRRLQKKCSVESRWWIRV